MTVRGGFGSSVRMVLFVVVCGVCIVALALYILDVSGIDVRPVG